MGPTPGSPPRRPDDRGLVGGPITTVAPTTTATALSSISTGLTPGEHGLIGYRMMLAGEVVNVLQWAAAGESRRRSQPPRDVQRYPAFLGEPVPVVSPHELVQLGLQRGASARVAARSATGRPRRWRSRCRRELEAGERFVYAYYGGVDKIAHERGFGEFYEAELEGRRPTRRRSARCACRAGAVLLVTADHGQVEVGRQHHHAVRARCSTGVDPIRRGTVSLAACPIAVRPGAVGGSERRVRRHGLGQ